MKRYWLILLCFGLILGVLVAPQAPLAQAQDLGAPIFFTMNGDIWRYVSATGALTQETTWGYNDKPIMSPDGSRFAYLSLANIGVDTLNQFGYLAGIQPVNIWVWDIATGQATRLRDQPANASIDPNGFVQNALMRRALTWSPDSTELAWVEINSSYDITLKVYNFNDNSERSNSDVPIPYGDAGFVSNQPLAWGVGGIALLNFAVAETPNNQTGVIFEQTLHVYNPNSGQKFLEMVVGTENEFISDMFWLEDGQIGLIYQTDGSRAIINPNDGAYIPIEDSFTRYNIAAPNNFSIQPYFAGINAADKAAWSLMSTTGATHNFSTPLTAHQVAVAPGGGAYAWLDDALYIWQNGAATRVAGTEGVNNLPENLFFDGHPQGLIWGATGWRLISGLNLPSCPNVPAPRLVIGGQGVVIPGMGGNVLRDRPGLSSIGSVEIGLIPPDGQFSVLSGPACASGYNWWLVNYEGQHGWTAEGEGSTYWLEPR